MRRVTYLYGSDKSGRQLVCLSFTLSGLSLAGSIQMGYSKEGSPGGFGNWRRVTVFGNPRQFEDEVVVLSGFDIDGGCDAALSGCSTVTTMINYSVFQVQFADLTWCIG